MAVPRSQEPSHSTSRYTYDVFLNFGEDTHKTFTDHLYIALVGAGFHTFRDDERGEIIKLELQKAIHQSRISIVVFSKDYASSRRCLDELLLILKHKRTSRHVILPVFYDMDPSQVRKQTGSIAEAFARYEEQFKAETDEKKKEWMDKLKGWREALREIADLAGMVLPNQADGIKGLNVYSVYARDEDKKYSVRAYVLSKCTKVTNRTKHMKWFHKPRVYGIPEVNEDMTWLSHWNFGNLLDGGDEVKVSVHTEYGFKLKEIGIHLVYQDEQEEKATISNPAVPIQQSSFLGGVPRHVSKGGSVFRRY